ncbi:MAG: GGDEF domain-containing protein, partial [Psychromonas sp.]
LSNSVPAQTIESLNCKVENEKVKRGVRQYEAKIRCADGTVHDYIFHTTPMIDSDDCITGEITAMTDVSEQCIAQKKKEKLITQMEQTNSKLKTMAIMDSVTNIFNRRYISQKLTEEFRKANIFYTPLSIVMLDIDHFKKVNDKFGHQFGDLVLHRVSQMIKEVIRDSDFLGRYGGEEYLLILPNTSLHNAILLGERIRSAIESLTWIKSGLSVTISGGCAEYNGQTETEFLKIADLCLYKAKSEGRNQIIANSLTALSSETDNSRYELV